MADIPVITEKQLKVIVKLVADLNKVATTLTDAVFGLESQLTVLSGENHPEGWKKVTVRKKKKRG